MLLVKKMTRKSLRSNYFLFFGGLLCSAALQLFPGAREHGPQEMTHRTACFLSRLIRLRKKRAATLDMFAFMPLFWWLELQCGSWGFLRAILFSQAGRLLIPPKHVSACEYHVSYKLALLARVGSTATGQVQLC